MSNYPVLPVNTEEQAANFLSLFNQRDPNLEWGVCMMPWERDRNNAQNALMWSWNHAVSKATKNNAKYVHGQTKLEVLLPQYKLWGNKWLKRANFVQECINYVPLYEHKVGVAYDMVRTNDLGIRKMAEYLTQMQQFYAEKGICLESNEDLQFKSLTESAK